MLRPFLRSCDKLVLSFYFETASDRLCPGCLHTEQLGPDLPLKNSRVRLSVAAFRALMRPPT